MGGFPIIPVEVLRSLVSLEDLLDPVAHTFVQSSHGIVEVAPPGILGFPAPGEAHIKSAYLHGHPFFVIKVATMFPGIRGTDVPGSNGFLFVCDAMTGAPVALLGGRVVTDPKTTVRKSEKYFLGSASGLNRRKEGALSGKSVDYPCTAGSLNRLQKALQLLIVVFGSVTTRPPT